MIATPKPSKQKVTTKHQEMFIAMLPTITRIARQAFSNRDPEAREEATAEVVAAAFIMFVGLVERAKEASSTAEDAILELLDSIDEQRGLTEADSAALAALESEIAAAEEQMQKDEGTFSSKV